MSTTTEANTGTVETKPSGVSRGFVVTDTEIDHHLLTCYVADRADPGRRLELGGEGEPLSVEAARALIGVLEAAIALAEEHFGGESR